MRQVVIESPKELFDLNKRIEIDDFSSEPLIIRRVVSDPYVYGINSHTNVGFRWGYFLWMMRGANLLEQLDYYSDHLHFNSDDDLTLRGAYGPRMKHWIGADQIVEANRTNADIDDAHPEDFVKPKAVDQFLRVYEDLKNNIDVSTMVIFDPAIDFEDSNDIPNLITLIFRSKDDKLSMRAIFTEAIINGQFINDYFCLSLIHMCMASWLKLETDELTIFTENPIYSPQAFVQVPQINRELTEKDFPKDTAHNFWKDIIDLSYFERHLRMRLTRETAQREEVSILQLCEWLEDQHLSLVRSEFWYKVGAVLMVYSIIRNCGFGNEDMIEFICNLLENKINGALQVEIAYWISMTYDEDNDVIKLCEDIVNNATL